MILAAEGDAPTLVFSGQQIKRSRLFFLSSVLDLAEWVKFTRSECLFRTKWPEPLKSNEMALKRRWSLPSKTSSFSVASRFFLQTPPNLVWSPEVCGEQRRVGLLQRAHTDRTRRGALPVQTQVPPRQTHTAFVCKHKDTHTPTGARLSSFAGLVIRSSLPWITVMRPWRSPARTT